MRPSVSDVAKHAGVSTATVSRVLNGISTTRPETRDKVLAAITELGYRLPESSLMQKGIIPRVIMLLVPDIANAYYGEIVRGIEFAAREQQHSVLLFDTHHNAQDVSYWLETMRQYKVGGVISLEPLAIQSQHPEHFQGIPWVACSEFVPNSTVPHVSIDHRQAARDAVLYLVSKGHSRIGLVNSDDSYMYACERRAGYEDGLKQAGIRVQPDYIQHAGGIDYKLGEMATRRLLMLNPPPTAIFAVSDMLAIGAMKAAFRAGMKVPQQLAVVGFDDIPVAEMFEPALTTIAQPMFELGKSAVAMLFQRMSGHSVESRTLNHALVIRESA
ncbi:LacI family DNA-binding transcriptional regulator [Aeromonas caviae]|uniref:LacI family DNA-binding transcriptional regulator n=1 Tax=Aeromonas caviae TaxID=648 RepID=UPI003F749DAC